MARPTLNAYQQAQRLAITPSAAEAASLSRAAVLLDAAKSSIGNGAVGKSAGNDYPAYAAALSYNQKFWTVLQADLTADGNALADELKNDLLSLSVFVDKQTVKALADPKPEHLDVLIEINRNIALGLREQDG